MQEYPNPVLETVTTQGVTLRNTSTQRDLGSTPWSSLLSWWRLPSTEQVLPRERQESGHPVRTSPRQAGLAATWENAGGERGDTLRTVTFRAGI